MATDHSRRRWGRFIWGAAFVLALFVAGACADATGPPNVPDPDEPEKGKPKEPEGQGFLVLPSGSQGFLV
ncbi:MAG: hypothetical protein JSW71_16870 [Gemmatimonadota bacterium]|nr:MAG: hypothetical protein JSW71_16870 [Gemmatimonadota bacterium]